MLRICRLVTHKISSIAYDFPIWENLLILHFAFCILHFAFPQSPPIFPSGNFSKLPKFSKFSKLPNASNASNAPNASNFLCAFLSFGVSTLKFPLCKGNKYPVNAENLCAEKSSSLQKQKKSSIFRTVICRISGIRKVVLVPNYLWHNRLPRFAQCAPNDK